MKYMYVYTKHIFGILKIFDILSFVMFCFIIHQLKISDVLITLNPNKPMDELYTSEAIEKYKKESSNV